MRHLGLILSYAVVHGLANWWQENTQSGRMFRAYLQNWRTDAVTGVGLAFSIVVGAMCLAVYYARWEMGY